LVIVVYDFWDGERMDSVAKRAPIELPVACTLVAPDGAQRMKQWKALQVKGRPSARRDGHQLIVACRAEPGVQWELQTLAAAERQCCSFASWRVS
jgi:hypothetical protein